MIDTGGFGQSLAATDEVIGWLEARVPARPAVETEAVESADGRVTTGDVVAPADAPAAPRADRDGVAVRAADTAGAGIYSPLRLPFSGDGAHRIEVGDPLPAGYDAVIPWEAVVADAEAATLSVPAAAGEHVSQPRADWREGSPLVRAGERLSPPRLGLLLAAGVADVAVRARPRVRIIGAGRRSGVDANGPMLHALALRDGAIATSASAGNAADLQRQLTGSDAEVVIVHGASGWGAHDFAASALAAAGTLAWHGVAVTPGMSFGVGTLDRATVLLLPGSPGACLVDYELFAGPLLRRLGGHAGDWTHPVAHVPLGGKLASPLGFTELRAVAIREGTAYPLAATGHASPPSASGFVQIAEGSEGFGPGEVVAVHIFQ